MEDWSSQTNPMSRNLKLLLVGPRRTGKSSSGNTLLGRGEVFNIRGGGVSAVAGGVNAGRHLTVVDAQGWGSSEEFVPRNEKIELLGALSLCGAEGPHMVLLVIPLLDFTEPERRAVERRMEVFTPAVWRHTMVLFTFGDCLKKTGFSVEDHIKSGGPALHWLMEKCRYRYHVMDNKEAVGVQHEKPKQEENGRAKEMWRRKKKNDKQAMGVRRGGEADGRKVGGQRQVRELLSKVEDMLQENGGWHFSLHMYQRLEEEWSRRETQLSARLKGDEVVVAAGRAKGGEKAEEGEIKAEQGNQSEGKRRDWSEGEDEERKTNGGRDEERRSWVSGEEDGWDSSYESGAEREEDGRVAIEEERRGVKALCWPNGGQRLTFSPIRRLA